MDQIVFDIISEMLKVCDGAHSVDGQGFNKYDAQFFRNNLEEKDFDKIIDRLLKYKKQITEMGFNYNYLKSLEKKTENKIVNKTVEISVIGDELHIKTPYNEDFINSIKKINYKHRRWNGENWVIKITPNQKDAKTAIGAVNYYYDTNFNIELPEISLGFMKIENETAIFHTEYNEMFIMSVKNCGGKWNRKNWKIELIDEKRISEVKSLLKNFNIKCLDVDKLNSIEKDIQLKKEEMKELSKAVEFSNEINLSYDLELYPFQKVGVEWLEKTKGRALIADEMGTGKTIQTLAYLRKHSKIRPVVIICPSSVKLNWEKEIKKWCNTDKIEIIKGRKGEINTEKEFYIINYDIISSRLDELKKLNSECIVIDESHKIKNYRAQRTEAIINLVKNVKSIICLTGTPIVNRPSELWTTLQILQPKDSDLRNFWDYMKKYTGATKTRFGWDFSGATNLEELQNKLRSTIMIRRLKKDVLSDLPEKQKSHIPFEITNKSEYKKALNNFSNWYKENEDKILEEQSALLVQMEKLKQISVDGKINEMIKFIKDMIENHEKVVIFAHHINIQNEIAAEIEALQITGGMSAEEKEKIINEFNNSNKSIVVSIKSGAEGMNLQSSSTVIFTELGWTPGEMLQAEDRVHRIGQNNAVNIYYLIAKNTIEEEIINMLNRKEKIIEQSLNDCTIEVENSNSIIEVAKLIVKKSKNI